MTSEGTGGSPDRNSDKGNSDKGNSDKGIGPRDPSRARRRATRVLDATRRALSNSPVSLTLLATIWLLGLATDALAHGPSQRLGERVALAIPAVADGRLWVPWTSALFASGPTAYLVATAVILLVAVPVESRVGSGRFAAAAALTQGLGAMAALAIGEIAARLPSAWGLELHNHHSVDPTPWAIGALLAATAAADTLWRRRIRTLALVFLVTAALFAGHLQDVTRLAAAVAGLLIGPWLFGRAPHVRTLGGTIREKRTLVALVVAASIAGPIFAAFGPHAVGPLSALRELFATVPYTPRELVDICADPTLAHECRTGRAAVLLRGVGPFVLALVPSAVILVSAEGLRRGRRAGWFLAVGAHVVVIAASAANIVVGATESDHARSVLYHLHAHTDTARQLVSLLPLVAVLVLLLVTRAWFGVRSRRGTWPRVWALTAGTALAAAVVYVAVGMLDADDFDPRPSVAALVVDFPRRLAPPTYLPLLEPDLLPVGPVATVLFEWTGVVVWGVFLALTLRAFLAPTLDSDRAGADRVRALLRDPGGDSLSWMVIWPGNTYWFSSDGGTAIAYRVSSGVALTTGDPIGPRDERAAAVAEFAAYCAHNGWTPCLYSVTEDTATIARDSGWTSLQVAEETVVDLAELEFRGKKFQDVRTALNRAKKEGIRAEWTTFARSSLAVVEQIVAISEEWVADKGMPEMGFTLGGLDELRDTEVRLMLAIDEHDHVHGVTSWMPVYRDGRLVGYTLDFMRRREDGFRPAMEFLIASTALHARDEGIEFLSLSGAPLARTGADDADRGPLDGLLDLLGRTLEPVYGFRSLLAFKSKFQPRYRPLFMVFPDPAALPSIGIAVGHAYLPDLSLGQSTTLLRTLLRR